MTAMPYRRLAVAAVVCACLVTEVPGFSSRAEAAAARSSVLPTGLDEDLLIVFSQPKPGREAGFLRWYDRHLEEFVRIPGVRVAERLSVRTLGRVVEGIPDHLAMYSLQASAAPGLDAEVKARTEDGRIARSDDVDYATMFHILYRPLGPPTLASSVPGASAAAPGPGPLAEHRLVVLSDPSAPDQEDAFNGWYERQHVPDVLRVPGFVSAQRYVRVGGAWRMPRYLVVFSFRSRDIEATDGEIVRRIRDKITVMSPSFGSKGAKAVFATPATIASGPNGRTRTSQQSAPDR